MSKVKVETLLKHRRNKPGDTYEVTDLQATALAAIGLVRPANVTAAKALEKVTKDA